MLGSIWSVRSEAVAADGVRRALSISMVVDASELVAKRSGEILE